MIALLRPLYVALALLMAGGTVRAQAWEDFVQDYLMSSAATDDDGEASLPQELLDLHESPVNLNTTTADELRRIPFITAAEADTILAYIRHYGPMRSVHELRFVPGLSTFGRESLLHFVYVEPPGAGNRPATVARRIGRNGRSWRDGQGEVALGGGFPFYRRVGYRTDPPRYTGDSWSGSLRAHYGVKQWFEVGLTADQDDGEPFGRSPNRQGFDFVGAYANWQGRGWLRRVVVGDYRAEAASGLVLGALSRNTPLTLVASQRWSGGSEGVLNERSLRSHTSCEETHFHRGAAASARLGAWDVMALASYRQRDATLARNGAMTTLLATGYHRLLTERERKHNVAESALGASAAWNGKHGQVGLTAAVVHYTRPFTRGTEAYRQHYPEGYDFGNMSLGYGLRYDRWQSRGEVAVADGGGWALSHELRMDLKHNWQLFNRLHSYGRSYFAPFGMSYTFASRQQNEQLILLGLMRRSSLWTALLSAEWAHHPATTYRVEGPSSGYALNGQLQYDATRQWRLTATYRLRAREQEIRTATVRILRYGQRQSLRLQAAYEWSMRLRTLLTLDGTCYQAPKGTVEWGRMFSTRTNWQLRRRGSLAVWGAWFRAPSSASALWSSQPTLLYQYAQPMFYHHGVAGAVTANWQAGTSWHLGLRLTTARYFDQKTLGTADRQIPHNAYTDLNLLLRYRF